MEKKETASTQPEKFYSGANNIPDGHKIVQHDVNNAIGEIQGTRRVSHSQAAAQPMSAYPSWSDKLSAAYDTLHCARRHQPGEAGSSTFGARSTRPGTIVRE